VTGLCHALEGNERSLAGAREAIRGLIEEVSLEPAGDQLRIILKGNLAGCCGWPKKTKGRRRPTTSWTKYCWLRGRATVNTDGALRCGRVTRECRSLEVVNHHQVGPVSLPAPTACVSHFGVKNRLLVRGDGQSR
jgi:hypothetical protein